MMKKKVVAIIVTWNKKDDVLACIESLQNNSYPIEEIIVVDNASTDDTVKAIQGKAYSSVNLIQNKDNLGGSGGFNKGLEVACSNKSADYFWLLDNDAVADKEALKFLVNELDSDDATGIAGSKIYISNTNKIIQEIGSYINWKDEAINLNQVGRYDVPFTNDIFEVDYVPACSMLVKRECVEKAGYIEKQYFVYWDDIDWCHRVKQVGYKIKSVGNSVVYHKFTGSAATTVHNYYFFRNSLHFFQKYTSLSQSVFSAYNSSMHFWDRIRYYILIKRYELIMPLFAALFDYVSAKRGRNNYIPRIALMNLDGIKLDSNKVLIVVAQRYHIFKDSVAKLIADNPETEFTFLASNNMLDILSSQGIKGNFVCYPKDSFSYDKSDDEMIAKIEEEGFSSVALFTNYRLAENLMIFMGKINIREKYIVDSYCNKIELTSFLSKKIRLLKVAFLPMTVITYLVLLIKRAFYIFQQ